MKLKNLILVLLSINLIHPIETKAFQMVISNASYPNGGAAIQTQLDALATAIATNFNTVTASTQNQTAFLESVGNANATSSRSYIAPGSKASTGNIEASAGGSAALALGNGSSLSKGINFPKNQLPPIGVAGKAGFTLGVSGKSLHIPIPKLDPARTMYHISFFSMDLSKVIGHGVTLKSTQAAVGMSYQVYVPQAWTPLVRYNGIKVSSALTYSKFDASYATPFQVTQTDSGTGAQMTWNSNVDVGVTSSVFSLNTEVTTGIRALWIANLYTGMGVDLNFGSSSITGGSSGPITGSLAGTNIYNATATISGSGESASPAIADLRYIVGTEFDLGNLSLYLQGTISTPSVYGLNLGAHLMF